MSLAVKLSEPAGGSPVARESGFTLLEVLVAFAIASIALAVLYHGVVEGLVGSRLSVQTDEAVARARSRIAALCGGARLVPGEQSGDDGGGYSWQMRINRAASETVGTPEAGVPGGVRIGTGGGGAPPVAARADLFSVRVTVSWPGNVRPHQVSLETRCLTIGPGDRP